MRPIRLMTLAPAHFHAALVHREATPEVHPRVHIYAPLGDDLLAHLERIVAFNTRPENPTAWELDIRAGPDHVARCFREQPGSAVVIAGRNADKAALVRRAVAAGLHVLVDKPALIELADLPGFEAALEEAALRELVVMEMLTERFEVTNRLVRELVADEGVFGEPLVGTPAEPSAVLESVHHIQKDVAGRPLRRPGWFFDAAVNGEGLADVGTHLADLAAWVLFPGRPLDYRADVRILSASRWPTLLSAEQYRAVTGAEAPGDRVACDCNNEVTVTLRGLHVRLTTAWEVRAAPGCGDTGQLLFRGTRSRVAVWHGGEPGDLPQVYIAPHTPAEKPAVARAVREKCHLLRGKYPGLATADLGGQLQLVIPPALRAGHETHFARVLAEFLRRVRDPESVPAWERSHALVRYYVTTKGVETARRARG